jgi:hypothetical protein
VGFVTPGRPARYCRAEAVYHCLVYVSGVGSYRKRALAILVAARDTKQKIAIFLRVFIVSPFVWSPSARFSLVGIAVVIARDGRHFGANAHPSAHFLFWFPLARPVVTGISKPSYT